MSVRPFIKSLFPLLHCFQLPIGMISQNSTEVLHSANEPDKQEEGEELRNKNEALTYHSTLETCEIR